MSRKGGINTATIDGVLSESAHLNMQVQDLGQRIAKVEHQKRGYKVKCIQCGRVNRMVDPDTERCRPGSTYCFPVTDDYTHDCPICGEPANGRKDRRCNTCAAVTGRQCGRGRRP